MEFQKFSNFHIHKKECVHWFSINIALLDVRNPQDVDKCNANWATVPKLTLQFYRLSTQLSGWCSEIPWGAQQLNISSWRWVKIVVLSCLLLFVLNSFHLGDVTFSCLVVNKGGECRWQKDGKVSWKYFETSTLPFFKLVYTFQPVGMYPGKYTLSEAEGDCSLTVHDVDIRLDDGHWQCQVIIAVIIISQNDK